MVKLTISRENLKQNKFNAENLLNATMTKQDNSDSLLKELKKDDFHNCLLKLIKELVQEQLDSPSEDDTTPNGSTKHKKSTALAVE